MVELWQARSTESLRQLTLDDDVVDVMSQQAMIHIARHGRLIYRKCSQSRLGTTMQPTPSIAQFAITINSNVCTHIQVSNMLMRES